MFGMYWYGDPADGTSIVAACGGGGSAATGVKNLIMVRFGLQDEDDAGMKIEPTVIKTGDEVGVGLHIAKNPNSNKVVMFCALGSKVNVYSIAVSTKEVNLEQELEIGDNVNTVVTNAMVDRIAVGCESGTVKVYEMEADYQLKGLATFVCEGHSKAVCAVGFAPRTNWIVSSAKDGTARVWKEDECVAVLTCSINDPNTPPTKQAMSVLVRGCGFGDLEGKRLFTVASGRKGQAFLSKWGYDDGNKQYQCIERTACADFPVSAMSISGDAASIALGATNGNITLWNVEKWKAIKVFPEVHDLPVTCIAARPFDVPLQGEEQSKVKYNILSASADSQMGWLTLQRHNPKRAVGKAGSGPPIAQFVNKCVMYAFFYWVFSPLAKDMRNTCNRDGLHGLGAKLQCIKEDILIAPQSRPGIAVPPH
jgi:hypothetical protein